MPVPGTLKRQPIDKNEIASLLERQFGVPKLETLAYLGILEQDRMDADELAETLALSKEEARQLLQTMTSRGLIIRAPEQGQRYAALHPRMTMTNVFKIYEREIVQSLRDRRATVDRIVNLLTPIYEEKTVSGR